MKKIIINGALAHLKMTLTTALGRQKLHRTSQTLLRK
jgi:hypothetical protein